MRIQFNTALALSLGIHLAVMVGLPISLLQKTNEPANIQPKTEFIEIRKAEKPRVMVKESAFKEPPPYVDLKKEAVSLKKTKETLLDKPTLSNTSLSAKEVVFVKSKEELDSFPAYIGYYDRIREKIQEAAYSSFHSAASGLVSLNFTVDNLGNLVAIYLDERNSTRSEHLKNIARKSIEASSPFPEFPTQLKQFQTLTFNLSIQFRNN